MDFFERFMFEELVNSYSQDTLDEYDLEDIYERFTHLGHFPEVKPYLYAMRFLGKGTKSEPDVVLKELQDILLTQSTNALIKGLYLDMQQISGKATSKDCDEFESCLKDGYSDVYLRKSSSIHQKRKKFPVKNNNESHTQNDISNHPEPIVYKSMIFEGRDYSGYYFTSGDIDYLNAKVFIEPVSIERKVSVRSQIYDGSQPFSNVFYDEFTLKPEHTWFRTTGWGNKDFYAYKDKMYEWRIEIDGQYAYSGFFCFYSGKIQNSGIKTNDVRLFASKFSQALDCDRDKYAISFQKDNLESIYFKLFIEETSEETIIQVFYKIIYLEDNSVFYDGYALHKINANWTETWYGIGYDSKGMWRTGLYKYSVRVGNEDAHEGIFSIY